MQRLVKWPVGRDVGKDAVFFNQVQLPIEHVLPSRGTCPAPVSIATRTEKGDPGTIFAFQSWNRGVCEPPIPCAASGKVSRTLPDCA